MSIIPQMTRIRFAFGARDTLGEELARIGIARPLLITDQGLVAAGVFEMVTSAMPAAMDFATFEEIPENPTIAGVERALGVYKEHGCDGLVAVGGGSVIDSSKAVATLAVNPGPITRYIRPDRKPKHAAPIIAVPTTAGTGSEVTRGAGIHPDSTSRAFSAGGDQALPKVAVCDPELTLTLPPALTAGTGMDALSHCVEGYLSTAVNPPVDAIALDGIRRAVTWIERAVDDGGNREARWHMAMAALEGGLAIAKGLGPVHAMANTFGDYGLHHGALVTLSMPAVLRYVDGYVAQDRMAALRDAMGVGSGGDVARAVEDLNARIGLPKNLRALGYPRQDIDEMAADAAASHFNATSPRRPDAAAFADLILQTLG